MDYFDVDDFSDAGFEKTFHPTEEFSPEPKMEAKPKRMSDRPERLEDVFQDYVVREFIKIEEFKKFARSSDGLALRDYDVETICEDYKHSSEEQKMQMLYRWKQKHGKAATPEKIRYLVDSYRERDFD